MKMQLVRMQKVTSTIDGQLEILGCGRPVLEVTNGTEEFKFPETVIGAFVENGVDLEKVDSKNLVEGKIPVVIQIDLRGEPIIFERGEVDGWFLKGSDSIAYIAEDTGYAKLSW